MNIHFAASLILARFSWIGDQNEKCGFGTQKSFLFVYLINSRLHCYTSNILWHCNWCAMCIKVASMTCLGARCVPCSLIVNQVVWACAIPTRCIQLWLNVPGHPYDLHSTCHHWWLTVFRTIGNDGEWWELGRVATTLRMLHCVVDDYKTI